VGSNPIKGSKKYGLLEVGGELRETVNLK